MKFAVIKVDGRQRGNKDLVDLLLEALQSSEDLARADSVKVIFNTEDSFDGDLGIVVAYTTPPEAQQPEDRPARPEPEATPRCSMRQRPTPLPPPPLPPTLSPVFGQRAEPLFKPFPMEQAPVDGRLVILLAADRLDRSTGHEYVSEICSFRLISDSLVWATCSGLDFVKTHGQPIGWLPYPALQSE